MRTILTLACEAPLDCSATLISTCIGSDEVYARLAESYGDHVQLEGDQVTLRLVEPLELITVARAVSAIERFAIDRFTLRAFAAAPAALDLLREDAEPTRSSWRWLCETLELTLDDAVRSFVAADRSGYLELENPLTQRVLVVAHGDERTLFDQDQVSVRSVVFDRKPGGWFVRLRWARHHHSGDLDAPPLWVNGSPVGDGHPVRSGDQIDARHKRFARIEVVAII